MSEPVSITEELRARIEELTRERDDARAELNFIREEYGWCENEKLAEDALALKIAVLTSERDNLRAEITKAQESFDDDGPSGWMPGETAVDALIRTRDEARAEVERLRKGLEPIADGTVWNAKESAEFLLGRKP
jgi:chromosome segregation ATPase